MNNTATLSFYDNVNGELNELLLGHQTLGRIPYTFSGKLTMSVDELANELRRTLHIVYDRDVEIYPVSTEGAIHLRVRECEEYIEVDIKAVLDTRYINQFSRVINRNQYNKELREGEYKISLITYYHDKNGNLLSNYNTKLTTEFSYVEDYMYPRINVPLMARMYNESSESNMILAGPPGTGKTCMAKLLIKALALHFKRNTTIAYVKDVAVLRNPEFWSSITQAGQDMLILDDLDDELRPRTEGRNEIINQLLSYSDGIFDNQTKIVITTNLADTKIDAALVRPGRCFDIINLPRLSREEAKKIWLEEYGHTEESFDTRFEKYTTISQAMLSSECSREDKVGGSHYLYDQSISVREKVELGEDLNHEDV